MEYNKQTPKREITISEVTLKVISPYKEGDTLTAETANVLNQTLAENFRNNFASTVKAAKEAAGGADKVDVTALQAALNDYMKEYEFGARRVGGVAVNPVEREATKLARDAVKKALVKAGKDIKTISAEQITELAKAAVAKNPVYTKQAEAIVAAKKAAGSAELGELAA